jgi:hypothetical protein
MNHDATSAYARTHKKVIISHSKPIHQRREWRE